MCNLLSKCSQSLSIHLVFQQLLEHDVCFNQWKLLSVKGFQEVVHKYKKKVQTCGQREFGVEIRESHLGTV